MPIFLSHEQTANIKALPDTLANPYEDIPINKEGWQLDYEVRITRHHVLI